MFTCKVFSPYKGSGCLLNIFHIHICVCVITTFTSASISTDACLITTSTSVSTFVDVYICSHHLLPHRLMQMSTRNIYYHIYFTRCLLAMHWLLHLLVWIVTCNIYFPIHFSRCLPAASAFTSTSANIYSQHIHLHLLLQMSTYNICFTVLTSKKNICPFFSCNKKKKKKS